MSQNNSNTKLDLIDTKNSSNELELQEHNHSHTDTTQGHEEQEDSIFMQLLGKLNDHDALYIGAYKITDLPKIYIDNGFHFFKNTEAVKESGLYTVTEHKGHKSIVNNETGLAPAWDLSITNFVIFQWLAILICVAIFRKAFVGYKKRPGKAPSGFQNAVESIILYVRDQMVRPNIPSVAVSDFLLPYFIALFFFIWSMNLMGLIPGAHTATGAIATTGGLAIISFLVINITAMKVSGVGAWFKHLLGGAPWWLGFIMVPIEVVGMFIKPFALTIRLFANMTAGHVILLSLLGILFFFQTLALSPAITAFSLFIYALELLVATIQAYLFTMLTAIFVGLAIGDHAHEHGAESHAH
jgi:F-type H+-transporting ATPase subunit a